MPVYDFHCPECGLDFEITRPRSEAGEPALCPKDGSEGQRNYRSIAIFRPEGSDLDFDMDGDMGDMMGGMGGMGGMGDMMGGMGGHGHPH